MRFKRFAFTFALVFFSGLFATARAAERNPIETLLNGHRIINVCDDFLAFWDKAEGKPLRVQRRLFRAMVESRHRDYFERAVYRNATREERLALLNRFLKEAPDRVAAIKQLNSTLSDISSNPIIDAIVLFRQPLPLRDYRQSTDIYFGLSLLQFDGSVRAVGNDLGLPDTLCLGADVLAGYRPEQIRVTIIHEFFHLYHFDFLLQQPDWYDIRTAHARLMIEGLAVAASEMAYLGQPRELYLNFSQEEMAAQQQELAENSRRYLDLIRAAAPPEEYGLWFSKIEDEDSISRGGYLLGYEVVKRLLPAYGIDELMRMGLGELRRHAEEQLSAMSGHQVLLMSGDRD
jgi:hypothetical protein